MRLREILKHPAYSLNKDHLVTNTWPRRHEYTLSKLYQIAYQNKRNVRIVVFGPGGISPEYKDKLPIGDESKFRGKLVNIILGREVIDNTAAILRRRGQQFVGWRETKARNQPNVELVCFEPAEIYELFKIIGIEEMLVVDKYQQVIDAVDALKIPNTHTLKLDLEEPLEKSLSGYNIRLALRVLNYCTKNPLQAYDNIINGMEREDLLVLNPPEKIKLLGFSKLAEEIYEKGNRFRPPSLPLAEIEAAGNRQTEEAREMKKEYPSTLFPPTN